MSHMLSRLTESNNTSCFMQVKMCLKGGTRDPSSHLQTLYTTQLWAIIPAEWATSQLTFIFRRTVAAHQCNTLNG